MHDTKEPQFTQLKAFSFGKHVHLGSIICIYKIIMFSVCVVKRTEKLNTKSKSAGSRTGAVFEQ